MFHQLHGLDYTILRIANTYGPRLPATGEQGIVGVFLARLQRGEPLVLWGDGSVIRDYIYVSDVVRAFRAALGQQSPSRVFNIGTGVGTSLLELITRMEQITGYRAQITKQPARPGDVPTNILDPTRARQHLQWKPTMQLEAGLRCTWQWFETAGVASKCHSGGR